MTSSYDTLKQEKATFNTVREDLAKQHPGKVVLFKDGTVVGIYETHAEAYRAGVEQFGASGVFLIEELVKTPHSIELNWELGLINVS